MDAEGVWIRRRGLGRVAAGLRHSGRSRPTEAHRAEVGSPGTALEVPSAAWGRPRPASPESPCRTDGLGATLRIERDRARGVGQYVFPRGACPDGMTLRFRSNGDPLAKTRWRGPTGDQCFVPGGGGGQGGSNRGHRASTSLGRCDRHPSRRPSLWRREASVRCNAFRKPIEATVPSALGTKAVFL